MREILFRGKRADNGEWVYGYLVVRDDGATYIVTSTIGTNRNIFINNMTATAHMVFADSIGQYTGLPDKNGKRIFEGDIVKCAHTVRVARQDEDYSKIRYSYGGYLIQTCPDELASIFGTSYEYKYWRNYVVEYFRGNLRLHNKSCVNNLSWNYIINHGIEVIGNIHDNPELLKGDNDAQTVMFEV